MEDEQQPSGFVAPFTDPNTGASYENAWIQIRNILLLPYQYVLIVYDVYLDLSSYESGMAPVCPNLRVQVQAGTSDWNSYFDPALMDEVDHNIQRQSVAYMEIQIPTFKDKIWQKKSL